MKHELGFDAVIDHRDPDFPQRLADACPNGIDVYFENVGGRVWDAVLPLLNNFARVPLCGMISHYNDDAYSTPAFDRLPASMRDIQHKSITIRGFMNVEFIEQQPEFLKEAAGWIADARLTWREDVINGLENAPDAFIGLLEGRKWSGCRQSNRKPAWPGT